MTLQSQILLLVLLSPSVLSLESTCDEFKAGALCSLEDLSDVISVISDLSSEVECQSDCSTSHACEFFFYEALKEGGSRCLLMQRCNTNTSSCAETESCSFSVTGPSVPSITEACCDTFEHTACELANLITEIFDVQGESACQTLCRDVNACKYWTLVDTLCFLYTECDHHQPCHSCTSGPKYPDIAYCHEHSIMNTLLLGGQTESDTYSTSVELITSNVVCTPKLPPLPVARQNATAVLVYRTILYCGGFDGKYHRSCHSYQLGGGEMAAWKAEPGMVHARSSFTLSLVGDKVYAIGGTGETNQDTVESYTEEGGWMVEDEMRMDKYRYSHCTVTWKSSIIIIGGNYGSSSASNSVQAIETSNNLLNKTVGWSSMESMKTVRMGHGCDVWTYEGQPGIVVAGGHDGTDYLSSVEFYVYEGKYWTTLSSLVTERRDHSLTVVGGQLAVAGGENTSKLTSIEFSNLTESEWKNENNLKTSRAFHSGVSVPAKLVDC